ncbi:MAG: hypothetical protein MUO52_19175, partial [Desulfobacterales bacterium]|nr:hypothetical protein [Desulfobacterales bacterium]
FHLFEKARARVMPKPLADYFSLFYYDTAVGGSASAIRCAYDVFGADRLIFATPDAILRRRESRHHLNHQDRCRLWRQVASR